MYCHEWREYTQNIVPIFNPRYNKHTFFILDKCEKCNEIKNIAVSDEFYEMCFPYYIDLNLYKVFLYKIEYPYG